MVVENEDSNTVQTFLDSFTQHTQMDFKLKDKSTHLMTCFHLLQNFVVTNFFCVMNLLDLNKTQNHRILNKYSKEQTNGEHTHY